MKDKNGVELELKDQVLTYSPQDPHAQIIGELIQFAGGQAVATAAYIYFPTVKDSRGVSMTQLRFDRELEKIEAAVLVQSTTIRNITPAINDYICPHCGNDRCNSSEIKCWLCGGLL